MLRDSSYICFRSSGENISPSALVLNIGIRLSLDNLFDLEASNSEIARHLVGTEEEEINTDFLPPPLLQMNGIVADVKSQQNSAKLARRTRHVAARYMMSTLGDLGPPLLPLRGRSLF